VNDNAFDNVVVTFSDHVPTMNGRMANWRADNPIATVLLFPADPARWTMFGARPRRLRSVTAGENGSFRLTGVPPGEYLAIAVGDDDAVGWRSKERLQALSRRATRVTVGEGAGPALTLTLQAVPR